MLFLSRPARRSDFVSVRTIKGRSSSPVIVGAGHRQRVGLAPPHFSLGTDILDPYDSHGCDALGDSNDSEQDESQVGLQYTDNEGQQLCDTHPDGADELALFLSSDVLSPSFNADHRHDAQLPAGVPCPSGDADKKADVAAWISDDTGDESDFVAEKNLSLKRMTLSCLPESGEEAASRLNEQPRGEKIYVGGGLGVASPSTATSLYLVKDNRHKTECRESLCQQAQCSQCFAEQEPTRPSGCNLCDRCRERATRCSPEELEGLTSGRATWHPFRASAATASETAYKLQTGDFAGWSRSHDVLMTRTLEGQNGMSCSYNCVQDKFSILQGSVVVWSGRWKDKRVCPSSDHIHCIIKPPPFWQVISGKKCLESSDVFVGFALKNWNEFERQIAHKQPVTKDHPKLGYLKNASVASLINKRGLPFPAKHVSQSRPAIGSMLKCGSFGETDAGCVGSEAPKKTTFFLPSVTPSTATVPPPLSISTRSPSLWSPCSAFAATATRASTAREGWARPRAPRLAERTASPGRDGAASGRG